MTRPDQATSGGGWTRTEILKAAVGGGVAVAGATVIGVRSGSSASASQPSSATDAQILNFFLLLERVQQGFYRQALAAGRLNGELREFAQTVAGQERAHVAFLARRLGAQAQPGPKSNFGPAFKSDASFRRTAIDLEEATIAAYIGQGANLTTPTMAAIAPLVSVEARQVAWIRDIAGENPAPRAADPARTASDVLGELRSKGYIE